MRATQFEATDVCNWKRIPFMPSHICRVSSGWPAFAGHDRLVVDSAHLEPALTVESHRDFRTVPEHGFGDPPFGMAGAEQQGRRASRWCARKQSEARGAAA